MKIGIMSFLKKVPSGLLIVPLIITALINTFFPNALLIGGPTTGVFKTGMLCVSGILLFASGATLKANQVGKMLKTGGVYLVVKLIIAFGAGYLWMALFGLDGAFGISTVALVSALYCSNPGVLASCAAQYGDASEKSLFPLSSLFCMQAIPIAVLEITSGANFDIMNVVNVLAPFIIGFILGNLDDSISKFMAPAMGIMIPFMGFVFGASIDLKVAFKAGISGIALGVVFIVVHLVFMTFIADKLILRKQGWCGMAFSGISGVAISIPSIMATNRPEYVPYVATATAQVALALLITAIIIPIIVDKFVKLWGASKDSEYEKKRLEVQN